MKKVICDRCGKEETLREIMEEDKTKSCLKLFKSPEGYFMDLCKDCVNSLNAWYIDPKVEPKKPADIYKPVTAKALIEEKKSEADILLEECIALENRINHLSACTNADTEGLQKQLDEKRSRLDEILKHSDSSDDEKKKRVYNRSQRIIVFKSNKERESFVLNNHKWFTPYSQAAASRVRVAFKKRGANDSQIETLNKDLKIGWYIEKNNPYVANCNILEENLDKLSVELKKIKTPKGFKVQIPSYTIK